MNHVTIFTDQLPREKQAEGIAVSEAVTTGACDRCMHLPICEKDKHFKPPSGAFCMTRKQEILREWDEPQTP